MISRHLHGYLYHLPFLLLTHWHIIFRICIFSFSSCISTHTSRLFFALRMPFRFPWADHAIKILRIIVSFLIVFSSGFCPFCVSSNALIHYCLSFLLKKKETFSSQYKHSYYFCFICCLCFRCPTWSAYRFTFTASWVLSVRQSFGIYRSVFSKVICSANTPPRLRFSRLCWNKRDRGQLPTTVSIQMWREVLC
jgi:hypothetical protein